MISKAAGDKPVIVSRRYAWGVLAVLTIIYVLNFVDRQIVAVLANPIRRELGLSNVEIGYLYGTAFSFFYAVFGIPMGRLADVWSRRWVITLGLLIWSLATMMSGLTTGLGMLVIARILVGINEAACSPAAYSLLSDYFPAEDRATAISIYSSGIFIGIGLAFLVGGYISEWYSWRTAFLVVGAPGILLALIAFTLIRDMPHKSTPEKDNRFTKDALSFKDAMHHLLQSPALIWHHIGFSFLAFSGYALLAFISEFLSGHFAGYQSLLPQFGWFMFLTGFTITISGKLADRLARKGDHRRFIMGIVAALGGLPFFAFGLFNHNAIMGLIFVGLGSSIASSYNGVAPAIVQDLVPSGMRAVAGGVYLFTISIIGFGFGPPITGYLIDHVYSGPMAIPLALFTVLATCGVLATLSLGVAMKKAKISSAFLFKE